VKTNGQRAAHDIHKQHAAKLRLPSCGEDRASFDGGGARPKSHGRKKKRPENIFRENFPIFRFDIFEISN
jgi:hypothetical protein